MIALRQGEPGKRSGRQRGFTLVELMVSLLIGLLIVLGATQLFLVSRQSFERVEDFGVRQGALNFSVDVLSRDVRRADPGSIRWNDDALELEFSGLVEPGLCGGGREIEKKKYFLTGTTGNSNDWTLSMEVECAGEPDPGSITLVSGFAEGGLEASGQNPSGLWSLTLGLVPVDDDPNAEEITFLVMNRMRALGADDSANEPEPGYDSESNKLYPNACYRGGEYDPDKPGMIDRTLSSPSHGRQKGTALVISLVLLVVCLMLGVSSMQASLIDERMAGNHRASIQAQMAAEAGASLAVAEAIDAGCNEPPIELLGGDEGNLPIFRVDSNIEEFYRINEGLTKQGGHARASYSYIFGEGSENKLIIAARGQAGSAISFTKVIISTLCEGGSSIFSEGLVAGGDIHINGSSVFEGNVHANGNLEIKGSYVQWREGAKITEGGGELSGSIDIPEIVFPEADQYIQLNTYSKKMKGKKVIMCDFNGSGNMQDEIYHCSGSLNIVGENISNATLLAEGGINNNGSIVLGEKGGLNVVVIAKGDINLNGSDWIYGALWAGGSIYHNGSSRIYGAVVAKEDIYRNGGMQYTQIKEITNPHIPFEGEKIEVAKWSGVY